MRAAAALLLIASAGCSAAPAPPAAASSAVRPAQLEPLPYIRWRIETPAAAASGSSLTGADAQLWSVAPEGGAIFGLTFALDEVGSFRLEAPRRLVPGAVDLADASSSSLWTLQPCASWAGSASLFEDGAYWSVDLDARCSSGDFLRGFFEGWAR